MKYCKRCLLPSSKPYLRFDDNGICSACYAYDKENMHDSDIDWSERKSELDKIISQVKNINAPLFDVLVPVSGGKDSLTQVARMTSYGLRVLAVSVECGIKTENGIYNLSLVPNMGATLITYKPEMSLHKELIRIGFMDYGDPDFMSHALLMAAPIHIALAMNIPMVFLGESMDYSGECDTQNGKLLTRKWYERYGMNQERGARFISQNHNIPYEKLRMYDFPHEFEESDTKVYFMSYFYRWDAEKHVEIAEHNGFRRLNGPLEGTIRDYVNTDDKINRIHHYMKVLKFGYGRATDHVSEDIRKGILSRAEGKKLVQKHDHTPLSKYYYEDFCKLIGCTEAEFFAHLDNHRNMDVWSRDDQGKYYIKNWLQD